MKLLELQENENISKEKSKLFARMIIDHAVKMYYELGIKQEISVTIEDIDSAEEVKFTINK